MARKKEEVVDNKLTVEEVFSVLEFAKNAYSGQVQGIYTPQLVNARMQEITMSPQLATSTKINTALSDPINHEDELVGYVEWLELNSMMFKRVLSYFSGLMSFDWTYTCTNAIDKKDYQSPAYKKDLAIVQNFFDRFSVKQEFRTVMKEMLRAEAYFGIFREDGEKYLIQELPQKYCKITGRHDYGLLFDFDFYWFMQPGVNLKMYPKIFTKLYNDVFYKNGQHQYNPASGVNDRRGSFVMWHQTSPKDGFIAFKFYPEVASRVPFLSPIMPMIVLEPVIRELQTNSYIQQASKIIFGEIPLLKETQAKLKDQIAISSENLGRFLALMKAAIPSAINVAAAPLTNTDVMEFEGSDTILNSYLQASAASTGINSRILFSSERQNVIETKLGMDIDQNIVRPIYAQFENFLEYTINKKTKKYKFKFSFEGFETFMDKEARLNIVTKLADTGIVLEQKYASAVGMNPFDFRRMLEETRANDFVEKLTPILKSSQANGGTVGRPRANDSDLSESGLTTRGAGSNIEKGGNV